ncbi:MAG: diaminopimelate epimerase [Candidatus Omnitrophota bacterium]|jgi:diaminopimelate epimerase|nr:MAG: diaminopimelate epimerase [Candidatus Omnitrophota bacterium]
MKKDVLFTKMVASGNDFVVIENSSRFTVHSSRKSVQDICDRKFGVGADGVLVLERSRRADIRMRIFNADGSEAEMCGNGARCVALYTSQKLRKEKLTIETKAGILDAIVKKDNIKIKLTDPQSLKLDMPVIMKKRKLKVNFINTGVPHVVIFVEGLNNLDIKPISVFIRYHKRFMPAGTNVDFVEVLNKDSIAIRTYERGVEDETLACGTGSVASALIFSVKSGCGNRVNVKTRAGEILKVYFSKRANKFEDVWLEGKAYKVHKGAYHV